MPQTEVFTNGLSFNLASALSAGATTLAPPSYTGWPSSGQFRLLIDAEIILVTDAATHPWPIARGQEGTTATSHVAGALASQRLTAGALTHLIAVEQDGTLEAIGRTINFIGGATVTQASDGVIAVSVTGSSEPIEFIVDGGGLEITTGSKGYIRLPYAGTIQDVYLMADQTGSIQFDILKAGYAAMPTTTSIVASAPPTLTSAQKAFDATLTGWTKDFAAGDWFEFAVTSVSVIQRVTVSLTVQRT